MATLLIILTFGAVFLLIFGVNTLIADNMLAHRMKVRKRLEHEDHLRNQQQRSRRFAVRQSLYKQTEENAEEALKLNPWERFVQLIDESGLLIQPSQVAAISGGLALLAAAVTGFSVHLSHDSAAHGTLASRAILALLAGGAAALLPILYVGHVRRKRLGKLLSQLPEAFDLMSAGGHMRAGQTISQAMQSVADDFSAPVADEFGYCCDQQNLGLSPEAAMRGLARRTGILEIKIFVLAVMVHRQTGGNLAELLDKLSTVIRERYRIRGSIQSLTAEGRMQMMILLALPPMLFAVLMIINRPYTALLFDYPSILVGTAVAMIFGAFSMSRIVNFDF